MSWLKKLLRFNGTKATQGRHHSFGADLGKYVVVVNDRACKKAVSKCFRNNMTTLRIKSFAVVVVGGVVAVLPKSMAGTQLVALFLLAAVVQCVVLLPVPGGDGDGTTLALSTLTTSSSSLYACTHDQVQGDTCASQNNSICEAGPGALCAPGTDCFDCDPCRV